MVLAENLVILRNVKGMTQEQVAEVIGISRQSYAKWEQGETMPDIEKCDRLAAFYGIKIDALLHYEEKVGKTKVDRRRKENSYGERSRSETVGRS